MRIRRAIAVLAAAATLGAGSFAIAAVVPVSAQDPARQETPTPEEPPWRLHHRPVVRAAVRIAAETIGIDPTDLAGALRDGQTVAEVAEAHGVDAQTVIDALVADAADRAEDFVNHRFGD